MKHILLFFAIGLPLFCVSCTHDFLLVRDGRPEAVIVRPREADEKLDRHIQFFNAEMERCTRTSLPVMNEAANDQNRIVFRLEERPFAEQDRFEIDFPDARTMRITGTTDSVRWALNHLLEEELGIRWLLPPLKGFYGPEINHYPQLKTAAVRAKAYADRPAVWITREGDWQSLGFAKNWNAVKRLHYVHGLTADVFPALKYAADASWPEAILPVINGRKIVMKKPSGPLPADARRASRAYKEGWQPCWSAPETERIAIANILEELEKDPGKKVVNLDVNDNGGYCECEKCRAAVAGKTNLSGLRNYSELYWTWVNKVASAVAEKHPDVIFSALAYREVLTPPSFKLHSHVLPRLCVELASMTDPVWYEKRIGLIRDWSEKASMLDLYDYMHGIDFFHLPRIYFSSHSKILAELVREYNLRSAYFESEGRTAFQGPIQQLMLKLLWDPDLDVEAFLSDWCEHTVGKKAAPYLREYYRMWEEYWTGEDIKKTAWYRSVKNVYMQLGECNSHTYALQKGDMARFRACMEKVVSLAETPEQKNRAQILMQAFEYSELAAQVAFSEILPPDGRLNSVEEARELAEAIPASLEARKKFLEHPLLKFSIGAGGLLGAADTSLGKLIPYMKEPLVREAIEKLSADPAVPGTLRAQLRIWLGAKAVNLIENGSFEQEEPQTLMPLWSDKLHGSRDTRYASEGKHAFKTRNGYYQIQPKIEQGKNYLFLCDVYLENGSGEGRFSTRIGPAANGKPRNWFRTEMIPTGGNWNTCSSVISGNAKGVNSLLIQLYFEKFENNEPVWIDNIRLYCLDDLVPVAEKP